MRIVNPPRSFSAFALTLCSCVYGTGSIRLVGDSITNLVESTSFLIGLVAHRCYREVGNFGDRLRGVSLILVTVAAAPSSYSAEPKYSKLHTASSRAIASSGMPPFRSPPPRVNGFLLSYVGPSRWT